MAIARETPLSGHAQRVGTRAIDTWQPLLLSDIAGNRIVTLTALSLMTRVCGADWAQSGFLVNVSFHGSRGKEVISNMPGDRDAGPGCAFRTIPPTNALQVGAFNSSWFLSIVVRSGLLSVKPYYPMFACERRITVPLNGLMWPSAEHLSRVERDSQRGKPNVTQTWKGTRSVVEEAS